MTAITVDGVARVLGAHLPVYRRRPPTYQTVMLRRLQAQWDPKLRCVLDVGGGTGVIAQAVKELFPVERVASVDVEDRYLEGLTIQGRRYDGTRLPFEDGAFDAVMLNNVLHHVPVAVRAGLLRECRRVAGAGPIYVKDHLARSWLDHLRLWALDLLGNVPFGGMVAARYLAWADWTVLAESAGCTIELAPQDRYRSGLMALVFPNRLEVSMTLRPSGTG